MDLETLVRIYTRKNKPGLDAILQGFRGMGSLEEAIRMAAFGLEPDGKRHPHQRRVPRQALAKAKDILLSATAEITVCVSFEELLALVAARTNAVRGFGELARYDTALRIGAFLGLYPEKVYLHAGTRNGARALGFRTTSDALEVSELPLPLHALVPHEIEDFLCIYKKEMRGGLHGESRGSCT